MSVVTEYQHLCCIFNLHVFAHVCLCMDLCMYKYIDICTLVYILLFLGLQNQILWLPVFRRVSSHLSNILAKPQLPKPPAVTMQILYADVG